MIHKRVSQSYNDIVRYLICNICLQIMSSIRAEISMSLSYLQEIAVMKLVQYLCSSKAITKKNIQARQTALQDEIWSLFN